MSQDEIEQLCTLATRIEQQAVELRRFGFGETAHLLAMAVLDLSRQVYERRHAAVQIAEPAQRTLH
jgi:hypothetical protein